MTILTYTSAIIIERFLFVAPTPSNIRNNGTPLISCFFARRVIKKQTNMFFTLILLTTAVCLIVAYLWNLKSRYEFFKQRGLPGPPPTFLFGHYLTFWSTRTYSQELQKWTKQYGPIYGLFEGSRPMYVVSDVDFLEEVYIKQFASFHSRRVPFIMKPIAGRRTHLLAASGAAWRRQRHVINPTFSTAKLKLMSTSVTQCIQRLMNKFAEKKEEFNIYDMYKRLTMDVICKNNHSRELLVCIVYFLGRCAFGIETDMQNDLDNLFFRQAKATVDVNPEDLPVIKFGNIFPFLIPFVMLFVIARAILFHLFRKIAPAWFLPQIEEDAPFWIMNRAQEIINQKLSNDQQAHSVDLLQLMLDVSTKDSINDESKVLHQDELSTNIFLFMVAGYETTSSALASSTYVLATQPDIQDQLRAEIDEQEWNEDNQVNYDTVMNMKYLDLFVREVLRMYPITTAALTRECNTSTNVCGHEIEKGCVIQPDVFTVHFDVNLWGPEDPNIFYPERHLVKRHPAAFMPFGIGPRNCVGMRFALMEVKMCLAQILREYMILPGEKIEQGFQFDETLVIRPTGIFIKLEKR